MPLIKYTNKGFLREHPFADPITAPTPVQTHSYIFPGDELVLYHKITLPDDASAASINDVKFISAKVSLIAQKPQVYSEEYSVEYQSTRFFELDSFITSFNNTNARIIPWGTDGYAPNVFLQQDRNWKLPPGDFRRQVNFFTKHTASTSKWDYWFYFPILFRWEYWIALASASDDFFDLLQPQNGQNNWWFHYFIANKWLFKSRLELNVLVNGVPTIIRNELNLSPGTDDINDYNSNADWINKSIKTTTIGGTPSNTPAFVWGNKITEVWGFFSKVSPWGGSEQGKISAVVWIEPLIGSGINARTRASSLYPVGNESVFIGLDTSITDDSGIGITTDAGDFIVTDANGNGVMVLFDSVNPEKVMFFAMIDYNKLNIVYPGVKKFMLYARLYNSTISIGETIKGEEINQLCQIISPPDSNSLCNRNEPDCPFNLDVYADLTDSDDLKNDKSDFYEYGDASTASIIFKLQKADDLCGDSWTNKVTISNQDYGKFFAFGKSNDFKGTDFEDDYGKKYTGLFLEWRKVLTDFGEGRYRILVTKTDVFSNSDSKPDNRIFCLKNYNCNFVNRTVRIDYTNEGLRGSLLNQSVFIDYAGGWTSQIRLRGVAKYKGSTYVKEFNQYGDADFNKKKPIINEQEPKIVLIIKPVPGWMDFLLSTNVLQADEILITDWNTNNRHSFIRFPVINDGDFTPRDNNLQNPLSDVEISFAFAQNNLRKRNSQ